MQVNEAIEKRRAKRSFERIEITDEMIDELAKAAQLAPSCFNNQPWRFVFVHDDAVLEEMLSALSEGNQIWAKDASLIIAVMSRKKLDCIVKEREYFLFDTGMATAFILLRATELGLLTHPIAGYDEAKAKEILKIPEDMRLITLVIAGKLADSINPNLPEQMVKLEKQRPERHPIEQFAFRNAFKSD